MHITQETDYAVRIVYCLANSQGRKDARTISEEMGVTLRFSLKILHKLVQADIVKSYKGSKGGYELAAPASQVNGRIKWPRGCAPSAKSLPASASM